MGCKSEINGGYFYGNVCGQKVYYHVAHRPVLFYQEAEDGKEKLIGLQMPNLQSKN